MSEAETTTAEPKKKIPPAALIGVAVAIGASLIVIFASGGKAKEPPPMELGPDMAAVALSIPA